jgi:IS30 family transposase
MARLLGRSPSTVSRELSRNGGYDGYRATLADEKAWDRARRPKRCKLGSGLIDYSQKMTMAAMQIADMNV